jgi:hypothetical protein
MTRGHQEADMALSSIVAVADNIGIDTSGVTLLFTPGSSYPAAGEVQLTVREQPVLSRQPDVVLPAVTSVSFTYGELEEGVQPAPVIPQEHWLREIFYDTAYQQGSWRVSGNTGTLMIAVQAGLRDNSPSGSEPPDDPFVCSLEVRAVCIWTETTPSPLDQLIGEVRRVIRV